MSSIPLNRVRSLWLRLSSSRALSNAGLLTMMFGLSQVLRLGLNVVLAHLLAPAIFGVMTLINTLRTGVDLLTDIGIKQNIIIAREGATPAFFNTGWTLQVVRGVILTVFSLLLAWPLAQLYGKPEMFAMLLVSSSVFLISGVHTPGGALIQRRHEVGRLSRFDLLCQVTAAAISIAFALMMPTVWGTIWALVLSAAVNTALTYTLMDPRELKLKIVPEHARAIMHFGKWIFVSSLVYFIATNFDRLYLPTVIPIALFGVYGIARVLGDAATTLVQKIGEVIILPSVAQMGDNMAEHLPRIQTMRRWALLCISMAIGGGMAISDLFVDLVYDPRYAAAIVLLPMLLAGTWFAVQSALIEAILIGMSRPQFAASGNIAKLAWGVVMIPLAITHFGLLAAMAVIAFADMPRYLLLQAAQRRCGLRFIRDDLGALLLLVATAVAARFAMVEIGLVDGLISTAQWQQITAIR